MSTRNGPWIATSKRGGPFVKDWDVPPGAIPTRMATGMTGTTNRTRPPARGRQPAVEADDHDRSMDRRIRPLPRHARFGRPGGLRARPPQTRAGGLALGRYRGPHGPPPGVRLAPNR